MRRSNKRPFVNRQWSRVTIAVGQTERQPVHDNSVNLVLLLVSALLDLCVFVLFCLLYEWVTYTLLHNWLAKQLYQLFGFRCVFPASFRDLFLWQYLFIALIISCHFQLELSQHGRDRSQLIFFAIEEICFHNKHWTRTNLRTLIFCWKLRWLMRKDYCVEFSSYKANQFRTTTSTFNNSHSNPWKHS